MTVIALVQGWYFVLTGLWPLLHIASFQKVTSRKTDLWLVNTVGLLLLLIGSGLILAALALLAVDLTYALQHVISLIYVLDALLQAAFLIWWAVCLI